MTYRPHYRTWVCTLPCGIDVHVAKRNVKRLTLRVRPDATVALTQPLGLPDAQARDFLLQREAWVVRKLAEVENSTKGLPTTFRTGETVRLWGRPLTIQTATSVGRTTYRAMVRDDALVIEAPPGHEDDPAHAYQRSHAFDVLLSDQIRDRLREILPRRQAQVGRSATRVRLRRMTSRWGSCNVRTGAVTLNLDLGERDPRCLDAVVTHELCHLLDPHHDERFNHLMDALVPDRREVRAILAAWPPRPSPPRLP